MSRVKISEFIAKNSLLPHYHGFAATPQTTASELEHFFPDTDLVIKVDQGIKKRGKLGLVRVNCTPQDCIAAICDWSQSGWSQFLVEPTIKHTSESEHYLSLERVRSGWQISYSDKGGIEVESNWEQVTTSLYPNPSLPSAITQFIESIIPVLETNHLVFLEMNPILMRGDQALPLDMACEADSAGTPLSSIPERTLSDSERAVATLDASTPASLKFKLINPEGRIWMLLSGGGASLVLADEVADQGMGQELANYGEYSGAPTDDDVYSYTKIILTELLSHKSSAPKAIVIAGGVANFTDVAKTFKGLIKALDEQQSSLFKSKVKVFVRRGGPNEAKGLQMMEKFLTRSKLFGSVHGHADPLTLVVREVKEYLS